MGKIRIRTIVVSVTDTRHESDDLSGVTLVGLLLSMGAEVIEKVIVSDDLTDIRNKLFELAEREDVDLIVTTGGTGFSDRDNTPEATRAVIEKEAPGLAEAMRRETAAKQPRAMLSRGICGIRGRTLIVNLPGSPAAVQECFDVIKPVLPHAIKILSGDTKH